MGEFVKIEKQSTRKSEPVVTITSERFQFNNAMKKIAELDKYTHVTFYVDEEDRRIAFEFKKDSDDVASSNKIIKRSSNACCCKNNKILKMTWVAKVSSLKGHNAFVAKQDGKKWIITLCPSFENRIRREYAKDIPSTAFGIYRYLDNGRIVYIGKGKIKDRYKSIERQQWKFDVIEYSIINDEKQAFEWESYWIENYKKNNDGQLPTYNLISGKTD